MSGGIGPTADIQFDGEEESPRNDDVKLADGKLPPPSAVAAAATKGGSYLTFRQLNALAVVLVTAASGMISFLDFTFVVCSIFYIYFLAKSAFPNLGPRPEPRVFDPNNKVLQIYVIAAGIVGIVLPAAYIFEGIVEGDKEGVKAAMPHVFLLASQVFMEGVFSDRFSTPIRAFVPIAYNSRRILTLEEWVTGEMVKAREEYGGSARRIYMGRALALANFALWCFNLFGFLLPVYLPRALKRYYSSQSPSSSSGTGGTDKSKEN